MADSESKRPNTTAIAVALGLLALTALAIAVSSGSATIPMRQMLDYFLGAPLDVPVAAIIELRFVRTTAAFTVGGMLALAGLLLQVILRNPLADPYVLGTAGGSATAALLAIAAGASGTWVSGAAFGGALGATVLVFALAYRRGSFSSMRLLLTGVVLATGWGGAISFILVTQPAMDLHGMLFWLLGDLSQTPWPGAGLVLLAVGTAGVVLAGPTLNVLARGALSASAIGVNVAMAQRLALGSAALLVAVAVSLAGTIGFIGLVVPHVVRMLGVRDHSSQGPLCVLLGGSVLTLADTLARTIMAPQQLPIGVLTAAIGVPFFIFLLRRS